MRRTSQHEVHSKVWEKDAILSLRDSILVPFPAIHVRICSTFRSVDMAHWCCVVLTVRTQRRGRNPWRKGRSWSFAHRRTRRSSISCCPRPQGGQVTFPTLTGGVRKIISASLRRVRAIDYRPLEHDVSVQKQMLRQLQNENRGLETRLR